MSNTEGGKPIFTRNYGRTWRAAATAEIPLSVDRIIQIFCDKNAIPANLCDKHAVLAKFCDKHAPFAVLAKNATALKALRYR